MKLSLLLRKFTDGQEVVEVSGNTALGCVRSLEAQHPGIGEWLYDKKGELRSQTWLFVNGERIYGDELSNPLEEGDELFILLAIVGG